MKFVIFFIFVVVAVYATEGAVMKMEKTDRDKRATDFIGRYYDTDGRFYRTNDITNRDERFFRTDDYTTGTYTPYTVRFTDYTPTTGFGDYYRGTYPAEGRAERHFGERDDGFRGTDGRFYFTDRTFY